MRCENETDHTPLLPSRFFHGEMHRQAIIFYFSKIRRKTFLVKYVALAFWYSWAPIRL